MIANMAKGTEIGRLLVFQAGWLKNRGVRNTRETSLAKWHATDHSVQAALDAIQIHGANGYSNEFPVERYLRNSKAAVIYEGTSQLHTLIQADYALGYREDRPLRCEPWPAQGFERRSGGSSMARAEPPTTPLGPPTPVPPAGRTGAGTLAASPRRSSAGDAPRRARLPRRPSKWPPTRPGAPAPARPAGVIESRAREPAAHRPRGAFRRSTWPARERYLLGWATSRIPQRRAAYQALRRAADVPRLRGSGREGANPRLAGDGYEHRPGRSTADPRRSCRSTAAIRGRRHPATSRW